MKKRNAKYAADGGNSEVLEWSRANGCPEEEEEGEEEGEEEESEEEG